MFVNEIAIILLCNVRIRISWGKCSDMHPMNLHIKLLKTIFKQQAMLKGTISCWDQHIKE